MCVCVCVRSHFGSRQKPPSGGLALAKMPVAFGSSRGHFGLSVVSLVCLYVCLHVVVANGCATNEAYVGDEIKAFRGYGMVANPAAEMSVAIVIPNHCSGITTQVMHTRDPGADMRLILVMVEDSYTFLPETTGPKHAHLFCPFGLTPSTDCLVVALCIIQSDVPHNLSLPMYPSLEEHFQRITTSWVHIVTAILQEFTATYRCDHLNLTDEGEQGGSAILLEHNNLCVLARLATAFLLSIEVLLLSTSPEPLIAFWPLRCSIRLLVLLSRSFNLPGRHSAIG